jgi:RHS repeat-associated protein
VSKSFAYDADGVMRTSTAGGVTTRVVAGDYRVNASTGEPYVFYSVGGRQIAWADNTAIKYLLADHLSSSHAEANQRASELGQRRMFPFGSDRAVSGASDLSVEERYTGQRRLDAGNGNSKRELYYYGARWYLPGVAIFSQAEAIMPRWRNPQTFNRYSYVTNNPTRYIDPTGLLEDGEGEDGSTRGISLEAYVTSHQPNWFDAAWREEFANRHILRRNPSEEDYAWRFISMTLAASDPTLLTYVGQAGEHGIYESTTLGFRFSGHQRVIGNLESTEVGPDRTVVYTLKSRTVLPVLGLEIFGVTLGSEVVGLTLGDMIVVGREQNEYFQNAKIQHEYVHVLQYRARGSRFLEEYFFNISHFEHPGRVIEEFYRKFFWIPSIFDLSRSR